MSGESRNVSACVTGAWMLGADETSPNAYPVRRMPAPAQLLHRLNYEMVRLQKCGFITCLCARIAADGTITIANSSHLRR